MVNCPEQNILSIWNFQHHIFYVNKKEIIQFTRFISHLSKRDSSLSLAKLYLPMYFTCHIISKTQINVGQRNDMNTVEWSITTDAINAIKNILFFDCYFHNVHKKARCILYNLITIIDKYVDEFYVNKSITT